MVAKAEPWESAEWDAQRVLRELTKIYNEALKPVGISINQFGLLAYLYAGKLEGGRGASTGALAEFTGSKRSLLARDLKPLVMRQWVRSMKDETDRRRRIISITASGEARLREAVPFWRRAQAQLRDVLGTEPTNALNDALNRASTKLPR